MTITAPSPAAAPTPAEPPSQQTEPTVDRSALARQRRPRVNRVSLVDAGFVVALGSAAMLGLATSFTGWEFLLVGVLGLVLGVGAGLVAEARGWPGAAPLVAAVAVFYLLGGPLCLRDVPAVWPVPHTWRVLTDQLAFGWKDLLTTLPPVDGTGPLLTLPWALGLVTGAAAMALVRVSWGPRWLRALLPVLVPGLLLGAVILLGVERPQAIVVQGVLFAVTLLGWLAVRGQRTAAEIAGSTGRLGRGAVALSLLVLAATVSMPFALRGDNGPDVRRVVLRDVVVPPFDIGRYPSPLASFRRYVQVPENPPPENLYGQELFTITGVEPGTRVRFATLDSYDGTVWGASDNAIPGARHDTYQRVSSTIDNPVAGDRVSVDVTIADGYSGVWLPVVGALQTIDFASADLEASAGAFRYNLATSTAVVPTGVRGGDRYSFTAVIPEDGVDADSAAGGPVGAAADAATFLDAQATEWSGEEKSLMRRVFAIADHLRTEGRYTDGVAPAEQIYHAGHFQGRLAEFVTARIIAGNDEQYAATMALLANRVGVPARVVMGAVVPEGGVVRGADVSAWVELQVADGSWRTLPPELFMGTERPAKLPPESQQNVGGTNVPPPAPIPPPSTTGEQADVEVEADEAAEDEPPAPTDEGLPGWVRVALLAGGTPLAALAAFLLGVVGAKALRRRLRRRAPRMSTRVVGAWRELVDHARDLGQPVPAGGVVTRREQSRHIGTDAAPDLAREADAHVFGPEPPEPHVADSFWGAVNAERRTMSSTVTRRARVRAAVSLRTFRRS